jgi:hypothetical protein
VEHVAGVYDFEVAEVADGADHVAAGLADASRLVLRQDGASGTLMASSEVYEGSAWAIHGRGRGSATVLP